MNRTFLCTWAYPRSRGGTYQRTRINSERKGLSPLARGNQFIPAGTMLRIGPIPARAGEPTLPLLLLVWIRADPRSRGGTRSILLVRTLIAGLSPLARGNRGAVQQQGAACGPIPARAGEPASSGKDDRHIGAYPRSRGGTRRLSACNPVPKGLSPLARGNPAMPHSCPLWVGPIPARAGEP